MARYAVAGAGITGVTAAIVLLEMGHTVEIFEAQQWPGGQLATLQYKGVLHDAFGAHIVHSMDVTVWRFLSRYAEFLRYRHKVLAAVVSDGEPRLLSWPPQVSELAQIREWSDIQRELGELAQVPEEAAPDLESWCLAIFGPTLYRLFIRSYTEKQWGRPGSLISSAWAPKRLELRRDGYRYLFRDPYQGWPKGGYSAMFSRMLERARVNYGVYVTAKNVESLGRFEGWIITGPLDKFFDAAFGRLEWRGVTVRHDYEAAVTGTRLPAPVVNACGSEEPFTRRYETKWMSGQRCSGTVISTEYPNSDDLYYPVYDIVGDNRRLSTRYRNFLARESGDRMIAAGRLATFSYINMDQAVRQGMNAARVLSRSALR